MITTHELYRGADGFVCRAEDAPQFLARLGASIAAASSIASRLGAAEIAAVHAERDRFRQIMGSAEAAGRWDLALALAGDSDLTSDAARQVLAKAPVQAGPPRPGEAFYVAMAKHDPAQPRGRSSLVEGTAAWLSARGHTAAGATTSVLSQGADPGRFARDTAQRFGGKS